MKNTLSLSTTRVNNYIQLTRLNRPIGIYLLLWPTLWALWLAADGWPDPALFIIFVLGTVLMRSAGCVINDFADRNFDGHVKRTKDRPMAMGKVSEREALMLFLALMLTSFLLVLQTNPLTIALSFAGAALAATYPFMKRFTHWPQAFLGAAFAWGIPMAWAAQSNAISPSAWILFTAFLLWTVAYDTQYAMVDRDDDLKIGIKSTAVLFGKKDNLIIVMLQLMTLGTMVVAGITSQLGVFYFLGVAFMGGLFAYQLTLTHNRNRDGCFKAFLSNHWAGAAVLVGIIIDRCII